MYTQICVYICVYIYIYTHTYNVKKHPAIKCLVDVRGQRSDLEDWLEMIEREQEQE